MVVKRCRISNMFGSMELVYHDDMAQSRVWMGLYVIAAFNDTLSAPMNVFRGLTST